MTRTPIQVRHMVDQSWNTVASVTTKTTNYMVSPVVLVLRPDRGSSLDEVTCTHCGRVLQVTVNSHNSRQILCGVLIFVSVLLFFIGMQCSVFALFFLWFCSIVLLTISADAFDPRHIVTLVSDDGTHSILNIKPETNK